MSLGRARPVQAGPRLPAVPALDPVGGLYAGLEGLLQGAGSLRPCFSECVLLDLGCFLSHKGHACPLSKPKS